MGTPAITPQPPQGPPNGAPTGAAPSPGGSGGGTAEMAGFARLSQMAQTASVSVPRSGSHDAGDSESGADGDHEGDSGTASPPTADSFHLTTEA